MSAKTNASGAEAPPVYVWEIETLAKRLRADITAFAAREPESSEMTENLVLAVLMRDFCGPSAGVWVMCALDERRKAAGLANAA